MKSWTSRFFKLSEKGDTINYFENEKSVKTKVFHLSFNHNHNFIKGEIFIKDMKSVQMIQCDKETLLNIIQNTKTIELKTIDKAVGLKFKNYFQYLIEMNLINDLWVN